MTIFYAQDTQTEAGLQKATTLDEVVDELKKLNKDIASEEIRLQIETIKKTYPGEQITWKLDNTLAVLIQLTRLIYKTQAGNYPSALRSFIKKNIEDLDSTPIVDNSLSIPDIAKAKLADLPENLPPIPEEPLQTIDTGPTSTKEPEIEPQKTKAEIRTHRNKQTLSPWQQFVQSIKNTFSEIKAWFSNQFNKLSKAKAPTTPSETEQTTPSRTPPQTSASIPPTSSKELSSQPLRSESKTSPLKKQGNRFKA